MAEVLRFPLRQTAASGIRCRSCTTVNRPGRHFCAECGAPLGPVCSECGNHNEPGEKFCGNCGNALPIGSQSSEEDSVSEPQPEDWPEPERRQLTVMFCDLVGSTSLSARLDPEDLRQVIRTYQKTCREAIARYDGVVARYLGDGIVAYFGYPQAHENDAERAVRAGLEIAQAMAELRVELERDTVAALAARVGIATGLVVAGDLVSVGAAEEQAVVGETPNLAAGLQSLAPANGVVISAVTQCLVGGLFELEDLGSHRLRSSAEPVHAWRVVRPQPVRNRFEAVHRSGVTPLVGREEELELLLRRWRQARAGEGQVVVLSGESGIGKSRLIRALQEHIEAEPYVRMRFQCSPCYANTALYPFIGQLERAAGFEREDSAEHKLDKLEALLHQAGQRVDQVAPLLADLLSIPAGSRYPPLDLSSQRQKSRTLAALAEQVECLAAHEQLLAIFEDAHWVDPTSLELLDSLIERVASVRVLLLITARPGFRPPWTGQPHVSLISLRRLTACERSALVKLVAGGKRLPQEVAGHISTKTDGVPLFVEELTKTILTSGLLQEKADRYALKGPLPPLAIPATLQDSLMARLDRLAHGKEVAQICAAIGREFSRELLAAVAGLDEAALEAALEQLLASELIIRQRTGPHAQYSFRHALVQEAAYRSLLKTRRQRLHANIAQALEAQFPEQAEVEPELLAHHYGEAGLAEPAIAYAGRAAQRALARSAYLEVIAIAGKALTMLTRLPETEERDHRELDFQIALGAAYRATRGFAASEAEASFARAQALCERGIGDTAQHIDVLRGLYACHYARGNLRVARQQAEQVIALAHRSGERSHLLMVGRYMLGVILFCQGDFLAARAELEAAWSLYDVREQRLMPLSAQLDPGACALINLSWTLWMLGYPDQAIRIGEQAIAMARELDQPVTLDMALTWAAWTRVCCGQHVATEALAREMRALTGEHGIAFMAACATFLEGQTLIAQERIEEGIDKIREAFAEFQAQDAGPGWPWAMSVLGAACGRIGRIEEGLEVLADAFRAITASGDCHWEAELYRLKGELLLAEPARDEAEGEHCLHRALEIARHQGARSLELRAAISIVRRLQRGKPEEVRALLETVYGGFSEGFDTADLKEARALLEALG